MTLQTLEYFIAVAQYRNFTKAAEACHVFQPALSRAIRGLEEELGGPLLARTGRVVTLTEAGEICLTEAQRVLQQCEELKDRVGEAARKSQGSLRVGYIIVSSLSTFMRLLSRELDDGPPFKLETVYGTNAETKRRLAAGEVDVAILPEPCVMELPGTEWAEVMKSRLYAIVPETNPLHKKKALKLAELKNESFIMWSEKTMPLLYQKQIRACREAGFVPKVVGDAEKMGDMLVQTATRNAIGLGNRSSKETYSSQCGFIPVTDSEACFGTACAWRKDDPNPQLAELKLLLAQARDRGETAEQ